MSNVRSHVKQPLRTFALLALGAWSCGAVGQSHPFSGSWSIDLRTPPERAAGVACGEAVFELAQSGDRVTGEHSMAAPGCGRLNEPGCKSVSGVAIGRQAVLVVTSCRNGAVVLGKAERRGQNLYWHAVEELRPGEPMGDSALILSQGLLVPRKRAQ